MSLRTPQFRQIEDATLANDTALPSAASTTVTTAVIDLDAFSSGGTGKSRRQSNVEVGLFVPALSTTILPDTKTMTLSIEESDSSTFASGVETLRSVTMTGAGGVGAAEALLQTMLPPNGARYVRGKMISGANTTDASALSAHFALKF